MRNRRLVVLAAAFAVALIVIVTALKMVLRLPGVPYNVSELFLDNGSVTAIAFFALALLWIGGGAMLAASIVANSRRPYVVLPLVLVLTALVSKTLISQGATYESLDDILGSNNLFGLVTQQGIWGEWWRRAFAAVGVNFVDFIERRVRYCALYSIPLVTLVFALLPHAIRKSRLHDVDRSAAWGLCVIVAIVWVWISGSVVLTYAATDNLTELIAAPLYLLGALVVMAANVGWLLAAGRALSRWLVALAVWAACIPITWLLINAGLEQHVNKYGSVFSAVQFLLGPDRSHALTTATLFGRWAVVYTGGVAVSTFGAWLADGMAGTLRSTSRRSAVPEAS